jgi:hypothetical protein
MAPDGGPQEVLSAACGNLKNVRQCCVVLYGAAWCYVVLRDATCCCVMLYGKKIREYM